jgi:hypothetical protein
VPLIITSNKNPVNRFVAGLFLAFFIVQLVFLAVLPVTYSMSISGYMPDNPDRIKLHYYWLFQSMAMSSYSYHGGYSFIYITENILFTGINYVTIPLALLGLIFSVSQLKTNPGGMDRDHARHDLLIGYILLFTSVTSTLSFCITMLELTAYNSSLSDFILFCLYFFLPRLVSLILSFLLVAAIHARIQQLNAIS